MVTSSSSKPTRQTDFISSILIPKKETQDGKVVPKTKYNQNVQRYNLPQGLAELRPTLQSICLKRSSHRGGMAHSSKSFNDFFSATNSPEAQFSDLQSWPHKVLNLDGYSIDIEEPHHPPMDGGSTSDEMPSQLRWSVPSALLRSVPLEDEDGGLNTKEKEIQKKGHHKSQIWQYRSRDDLKVFQNLYNEKNGRITWGWP